MSKLRFQGGCRSGTVSVGETEASGEAAFSSQVGWLSARHLAELLDMLLDRGRDKFNVEPTKDLVLGVSNVGLP